MHLKKSCFMARSTHLNCLKRPVSSLYWQWFITYWFLGYLHLIYSLILCQKALYVHRLIHLTCYKRHIILFCGSVLKHLWQVLQSMKRFTHQNKPRCISVQAVAHRWLKALICVKIKLSLFYQVSDKPFVCRNISLLWFLRQHIDRLVCRQYVIILVYHTKSVRL